MCIKNIFPLFLLIGVQVNAHISFSPNEGMENSMVTTAFRVGHGCSDAEGNRYDTIKTMIEIPEGFISTKPEQQAGFDIDITYRPVDPPEMRHGREVTSTIHNITYTGLIHDSMYLFLGLRFRTPAKTHHDGMKYPFKVWQECTGGDNLNWVEASGGRRPSPTFTVYAIDDDSTDSMMMPGHNMDNMLRGNS